MNKPLSYVEIFSANLLHNLRQLRRALGKTASVAAVVKGNAYGHGQFAVVQILDKHIDYFQVDDMAELMLLRKVSKKPTLVLGYVSMNELALAVELDAIPVLYDTMRLAQLERLGKRLNKKILVHIKIDALLGRQGVLLRDLELFIRKLKKFPHVIVDGVYSHFANIEDTTSFAHASKQIMEYQKALDLFRKHGFKNFKSHISATSGVLEYELAGKHSIARIGLGLYGMWPSENLQKKHRKRLALKPVMKWVTHIAQIKTLPKNYPIGYGLTYITKKQTKIALIPQGYSDGYDRALSNTGEVLIRGKRCRVLGRVAMNMFVVDVSHVPQVRQEDEVVLLGRQGKHEITAEEIAQKIGTINYEVTTRVSPLLPRLVK